MSVFLDTLPPAERELLLAAGHARQWQRQEFVVRSGDPATSVILLVRGQVKIHGRGGDGAEVVFGLLGPGDLLGEISLTRRAVRSLDATALEPVEGVVVAVRDLRALLQSHPAVTLTLLELALDRLRVADSRRVEYATAESLPRVTRRLVELTERFGTARADGAIEVDLPINQEELASWSAASREATARALRTLRELRLIETHRRRLVVHDLERLRTHAART